MKVKIAITIDDDILKSIKEISIEEDRSVSSQINNVLKDFLASKGLKEKKED